MGRAMSYLLVPLLFAFFISFKVMVNKDCAAFDMSDDANHTFVHMMVAKEAIVSGQMPLINLYHNFGTPLIGDVLTYPFSPLALSYWFFSSDTAMMINRFLVAFLTVMLLTIYFHRRMNRPLASACALIAVLTPAFLWCMAHHHYQMTLVWFTLALLWQEDWAEQRRWIDFFKLCLVFIFAGLSISMNLLSIMVLFLLMNQIFLLKGRLDLRFGLFLASVGCGLLFIMPDIMYLSMAAGHSVRTGAHYSLVGGGQVLGHVFWPCLFLAVCGAWVAWRKQNMVTEAWRILLLGPGIVVMVMFVMRNPALWDALPFFHSTDLTRFYWMAGVFVMLGAGVFLSWLMSRWGMPGRAASVGIILIVMGLAVSFASQKILGYYDLKTCRLNDSHYFSYKGTDIFPRFYARLLEPYSRVAADWISSDGIDIRLQRDHVLGSAGRSAVMVNAPFRAYLQTEDLIEIEPPLGTYHFKAPWDADKLATLGIRYVMGPRLDREAMARGWKLLGYGEGVLYVYENPLPVGLLYLKDSSGVRWPVEATRLSLKGDVIRAELSDIKEPGEMVATFIHLRGWKAWVDGARRKIVSGQDQLMRVKVFPGEHSLVMKFEPFAWYDFIGWIGAALAVPGIALCLARRYPGVIFRS